MRKLKFSKRLAPVVATVAALGVALAATAQLPPPPQPAGNPTTPAKVNLGKTLFWDEQVSSTRTVACGTCHIPSAGGEDPRSGVDPLAVNPGADGTFGTGDDVFGSLGVPLNHADGLYDWSPTFGFSLQVTGRKAPAAINAGYAPLLFWDGRAPGQFVDPLTLQVVLPAGGALESQSVGPPVSDVEMAHVARDWQETLDRIAASEPLALSPQVPPALRAWIDERGYPELFAEAFGTPEITAGRFGMAVAAYERTQFTNQSPFDEFLAAGTGLTAQEQAGRAVFAGAAQCDNCHQAAIMSDHLFHFIGVRPRADDPGRMAVTGNPADEGKMRTPSLRNLELRAPYMRSGRFQTLEEVVDFYVRGGDFFPNDINPVSLTPQQRGELLAFLRRPLTDPRLAAELPPFDRPALYSTSARVPAIEGTGVVGSGDFLPAMVAIEPPLLGNPSFTVGVWSGLGGAAALLAIDDADPGVTPPASAEFAFENVVLGGSGDGAGFGSVSLAIPNDLSLEGREWFGRWYVTDPGATGGVAVSRLVRFRTFASVGQHAIFDDGFESGDTAAWSASVP